MKAVKLFLMGLLMTGTILAKTWTVSQTLGANFTTLVAAVGSGSVLAGDTILVSGAPATYTGINLTKRLTIIGPGYFLGENTGLQVDTSSAKISTTSFNTGSAGSVIMGLYFVASVDINTNDITFTRNRLLIASAFTDGISIGSNLNNITITQCYLTLSSASAYRLIYMTTLDSNIIIRNNYLENLSTSYGAIDAGSAFTGSVSNNVIYSATTTGVNVHSATFNNNIIRGGGVNLNASVNPYNNISNSTQFSTWTGDPYNNQINQNTTAGGVFISSGTSDGKWQIAAAGPADNKGFPYPLASTVDCGMFDNSLGTGYVLSGVPPVPSIYLFNATVGGSNITIDVSVKSNN